MNNVIVGSNSQQKASTNSFYESDVSKLEPMWTSVGHGDHMGITAVGFVPTGDDLQAHRPEGRQPGVEGGGAGLGLDAPPWPPGQRHVPARVPRAGMFNFALTAGLPDLYDMCGKNVDDWGTNCPHYFEGWRRRSYNINKVDGDASTGGAWSRSTLACGAGACTSTIPPHGQKRQEVGRLRK